MSSKLLKSTAVVSTMTMLSRVSGLMRDAVIANVVGAGAMSDAFFVAFRIPNFLRRIFGEGAFAQAFVPVFSQLTEQNTHEARKFVNTSAGLLGLITLLLSVLGIIFAPQIITLFASGFQDNPEKLAITVDALRWMFPYLFFISLVAMSGGILNSVNRFAVPAATPVLLNLCMILALVFLLPHLDNAAQTLAIGVLIAGAIQLLFQIPSLKKQGYLPKPNFDSSNPHVKKVAFLMLPAIFSVSVAQVNMLVNTYLASFLVDGSISWLYFADRLMEFPVGVFGIALATVVLPSLAKEYTSGSPQSYSGMMDWALRWVVLIAFPATAALFILATPLLSTIFQYNAFTSGDVAQATLALKAFAVGVSGFIFVKVLAPGFFARQDTQTPMRVAVVAVVANIIMSIILVKTYAHAGLALSISLAAWINATLLFVCLCWQGIFKPEKGWLFFLLRVLIAVAVMVAVLIALNHAPDWWYQNSLFGRIGQLSILVIAGAASYFAVLLLLGIRPQQLLLNKN